ncbi:branched-chain amino acid ABC transporter permease [Leptolyngbya sp. NK1-12]|uniref:Branched-chain amino acid ABC transporter permease n=1 Tax=Leptolyngbya sp. NK1-12 TaxID=2547451 RepID=A0AA96WFL1_9CYAN|nr:urea ABC transporter permease subunit UrtB [Leptolyngbya sp. NK1-12]WNZ24144.1 branched-chain amino acid ABC transporter permease [Leptolyngbya sp. NK1-12]
MELEFSIFSGFYQFIESFAFLLLSALGLAVIFGMTGVINLAHGEFIMLGAYTTTLAGKYIPLPLAILVSALVVGIYGAAIERLIIRRLYERVLDSVVATWGIGLLMSQGVLILLGSSIPGLQTPLGSFSLGQSSYSWYRLVLGLCAVAAIGLLYFLLMHTQFGLWARATTQNAEIAQAMGVNTSRVYTAIFAIGSALAGFAGGLYAPTASIIPKFGAGFVVEAFVTVIVGGANLLVGTSLAAIALGGISTILSSVYGSFVARVGLLLVTIVVIRILPYGLSGLVERWRASKA